MKLETRFQKIIERAYGGIAPDKSDCIYLLTFPEASLEASLMRAAANDIIRTNSDNSAIMLGQIGIDVQKCSGGCKFCTFGEGHTQFEPHTMNDEELREKVTEFTKDGDLYGLYLLTMHEYHLDYLLHAIKIARETAPSTTQIWVNIGDTDLETFQAIKAVGVTGVYHVCRINEGIDTNLDPKERIRTMDNAIAAGLELYTCCEPIGPEHTPEMLVENMFIGIERNIYQHAAMRRVAAPGTPLARYGQISELRLAQIVSVIALASLCVPTLAYLGVHEPNELGYCSGANIITAESGANPRDTKTDTAKGRGFDLEACRTMMRECGFQYLRRGDESKIIL